MERELEKIKEVKHFKLTNKDLLFSHNILLQFNDQLRMYVPLGREAKKRSLPFDPFLTERNDIGSLIRPKASSTKFSQTTRKQKALQSKVLEAQMKYLDLYMDENPHTIKKKLQLHDLDQDFEDQRPGIDRHFRRDSQFFRTADLNSTYRKSLNAGFFPQSKLRPGLALPPKARQPQTQRHGQKRALEFRAPEPVQESLDLSRELVSHLKACEAREPQRPSRALKPSKFS